MDEQFKSESPEEYIINNVIKDEPMIERVQKEYAKFAADDKLRLIALPFRK